MSMVINNLHFLAKTPNNKIKNYGFHETKSNYFDIFDINRGTHSSGDVFAMPGVYTKNTNKQIMNGKYLIPLHRYSENPLNLTYKSNLEDIFPELKPMFLKLRKDFPLLKNLDSEKYTYLKNNPEYRKLIQEINKEFRKLLKKKGYDSVNSIYDFSGAGLKEYDNLGGTLRVTDSEVILNPNHVKFGYPNTVYKASDPEIGTISDVTGLIIKEGDVIPLSKRHNLLDPRLRFITIPGIAGGLYYINNKNEINT